MKLHTFIAVVSAALMLSLTSCMTRPQEPVAANSANPHYGVLGSYTATMNGNLFQCNRAVVRTAKEMRLIQLSRINESDAVIFAYKDVYETRISVRLEKVDEATTNIRVRVGKTGDRIFSRNFISAVGQSLSENGAAPAIQE